MSKFKVGDIIRPVGVNVDTGWCGVVKLVGIVANANDMVVEVVAPKSSIANGQCAFVNSIHYELVPKLHKIRLLTYRNNNKIDTTTGYTREDFERDYPSYDILDVREIEIELKE